MWEHDRLLVYRKALAASVEIDAIARTIPYERQDLRMQVLRASSSVVLNIAEGAGEYSPREKVRFYRMARRSAAETASSLDLLAELRLTKGDLDVARGFLARWQRCLRSSSLGSLSGSRRHRVALALALALPSRNPKRPPPAGRLVPFRWPVGARTLVMGVVNVTPDSFSDGGRHPTEGTAVAHGLALLREGADVLDVGGESTRPGAAVVDADEEARRVVPVIRRLAEAGALVSVDTRKAVVASQALAAGALIVNDVSAGRDPEMFATVAQAGAGLVLTHMQGEPATMQRAPSYHDVVKEVSGFLLERAQAAQRAGVARDAIALDPGIGFGKTAEHNLALLREIGELKRIGHPVLVGASRKQFLGVLTREGEHVPSAVDRLEATIAAHVVARERGADIVRCHDVRAHRRAFAVADAIRNAGQRGG